MVYFEIGRTKGVGKVVKLADEAQSPAVPLDLPGIKKSGRMKESNPVSQPIVTV